MFIPFSSPTGQAKQGSAEQPHTAQAGCQSIDAPYQTCLVVTLFQRFHVITCEYRRNFISPRSVHGPVMFGRDIAQLPRWMAA